LAWFHVADAVQAVTAFVLRAYRITKVPLLINAVALWALGLGGGYVLAFDVGGNIPGSLQGARGFWIASTAGLMLAAAALCGFMAWRLRHR
jgi:MATE family multidrug resistance protein